MDPALSAALTALLLVLAQLLRQRLESKARQSGQKRTRSGDWS